VVSPPRPELAFRARKILYAAVAEYIGTGEPVGSRKLSKRYGLNLSPASIRNVLADLEEAGYLTQPHTSAGRVPTELGFRVFVDALVQMRQVGAEDRAAIVKRMSELNPAEDDVIRETGKLLSALTGAAALVTSPRAGEETLSQVRFVPLREGQLLAVLVSRTGIVQNRVVQVLEEPSSQELERLHNYLAELVEGRTLSQVRDALADEMDGERDKYDELRRLARDVLSATASGLSEDTEVLIEGQGTLFDRPEFTSVEKIRAFLKTFEEKELLVGLLDRTLAAGGVQVLIGSETNLLDVEDISLISASYGQRGTGALGVIGPTRMDYGKVVPLVQFTAQVVGQVLGGDEPDPD